MWIWGVPGKGARGTPDKALTQSLGCITGQAEDLGASWGHPSGLEDLSLGIAQGWVQGELSFPGSGFVQGASAWCRDGGRGQWVEAPGVGEQATAPRDGDSLGVRRGGTAPVRCPNRAALSRQVQAQLQLEGVAHAHPHLHPHLAAHAPYLMFPPPPFGLPIASLAESASAAAVVAAAAKSNSKNSSIADLRLKARKHAEALGL